MARQESPAIMAATSQPNELTGGSMSHDHLDALVARLATDPAFAAALGAAANADDAQRIAAEYGFDLTTSELTAASIQSNLSDADLEAVSGGIVPISACQGTVNC